RCGRLSQIPLIDAEWLESRDFAPQYAMIIYIIIYKNQCF
ncbi:MAG: hypothetical protein RLZZ171_2649, partial [Cyanobacteriota bacterium]